MSISSRPTTARPSILTHQSHYHHGSAGQSVNILLRPWLNNKYSFLYAKTFLLCSFIYLICFAFYTVGGQQPTIGNYNTHSLDRHAHLNQFVNTAGELVYESSLREKVPYRYNNIQKPSGQNSSVYATASEYSIGQSRPQYSTYDMIGQQRRSNGRLNLRCTLFPLTLSN